MLPKIKPEIKHLIDLQTLDLQFLSLRDSLPKLEAEIRKRDHRLQQLGEAIEDIPIRRKELVKKRHLLELDLKAMEEQLRKQKGDLLKVRDNVQYEACQREIHATQGKIDQLETQVLELMEEEESIRDKEEGMAVDLRREGERLKEEQKKLQQELIEKNDQLRELRKQRQQLFSSLTPELQDYYRDYSHRYPGNLAVEARKGSCGGCNMELTAQVLVEIHRGNEIIYCERCRRILAYDVDFKPKAQVPAEHDESGE